MMARRRSAGVRQITSGWSVSATKRPTSAFLSHNQAGGTAQIDGRIFSQYDRQGFVNASLLARLTRSTYSQISSKQSVIFEPGSV